MPVITYTATLHVGGMFQYVASEAWTYLREVFLHGDANDAGDIEVIFVDPHEVMAIWVHCRASNVRLTVAPSA